MTARSPSTPMPCSGPLIDLTEDPFILFSRWMKEAEKAEPADANAMSVATATQNGFPSVRILLLKAFDQQGFVFYTNDHSRKGRELQHNPHTALLFYWKSLRRQIRIEGSAELVSEAEADAYFASRSWLSRIGAVASEQSSPLADRAIFEQRLAELKQRYPEGKAVPRPAYWRGHRVRPKRIEFWQERPYRLHDRALWMISDTSDGLQWMAERLYP